MNKPTTVNINDLLAPSSATPTQPIAPAPATEAEATKWAEVHALSLKPGRWYKQDDDDNPMPAAVYQDATATVATIPGGIAVYATFAIPTPDDSPAVPITRAATPEHPFEEIPAPLTRNGNPIKSESRKTTATVAARVTVEERDEVKAMAAARGLTVSQLIRDAIGLALDPDEE